MRIPREKLYEEVWAEPMTTVAKRYEVSSNYLARICERLNIPRPGRGYWQQRAVGADVEMEPLPEPEPGDEIEWARDGSNPAIAPMSSTSPRPRTTGKNRPDQHPLLVAARGLFEDVRGGREVLYLVPRKTKLVDIFVTKATLGRALKVASDLFLYLEDRGHRVVLAPPGRGYQRAAVSVREGVKSSQDYGDYERGRWQPISPTTVLLGDVAIGLTFYETMEETDAVWRDGRYVRFEAPKPAANAKRRASLFTQEHVSKHWFPTGRLGLHAYSAQGVAWEQTWVETKEDDLTSSFEAIGKTLDGAVLRVKKLLEEQAREQEKRELEWAEQRKRWRREEEERRAKEEEASRLKRIQEEITSWRLAKDIRSYVAEVRALVRESDLEITEGSGADKDLAWAERHADRVDPLSSWRRDIAEVKAKLASEPCPNCGKVHGPAEEGPDVGQPDATAGTEPETAAHTRPEGDGDK